MKTSELRIGNFINGIYSNYDENLEIEENETICKVTSLDNSDLFDYQIYVESDEGIELFDEFEPIPLTEEWLLKFGFKKIGVNFQLKSFCLWYSSYEKCYVWRFMNVGEDADRKVCLDYVHQLQNLYFSLTGEELKLRK
jgi:hypothetical protein